MDKIKFKLGIIDEYQDDIDDFKIFFENDFEIVEIELKDTVEDIVNEIVQAKLDAVAIDYKLTEHNSKMQFNGNEIFNYIENKLYKFPAFILTNYVPDASQSDISDEFKIISKRWLKTGSEEGNELIEKIKNAIIKYKQLIQISEEELISLMKKKAESNLSAKEEECLIEIDNFLESVIDKENAVPSQLKKQKNELAKLIELAENILKNEEDK